MPGVKGAGCDQRVAEIESRHGAFRALCALAAFRDKFIDSAAERRKIERLPERQPRPVSRLYAVLPVAGRQRERQAAGNQGLDERIGIIFAKRHVHDGGVDLARGQFHRRGQIVRRADHDVTKLRQPILHHRGDQRLVVDDQNLRHSGSGRGRTEAITMNCRTRRGRSDCGDPAMIMSSMFSDLPSGNSIATRGLRTGSRRARRRLRRVTSAPIRPRCWP